MYFQPFLTKFWIPDHNFWPKIADLPTSFNCIKDPKYKLMLIFWSNICIPNMPKYRHYDIAYCYIIVPSKSQSSCCRRKKASIFQAVKLKIYLKYAFNLNLCYYNFVCSVSNKHKFQRAFWAHGLNSLRALTNRHVSATKSYLHFDRFAGEAILCSNFFCFLLFLDV